MDPVVVGVAALTTLLGSVILGRRAIFRWLGARMLGVRWALIATATALMVGAAGLVGAASAAAADEFPMFVGVVSSLNVEPSAPADSFPHQRHTKLACLECHETGGGHGRLTFEQPRGCAVCHHQAPDPAKCGSCHRSADYGSVKQTTVTISVVDHDPRPRPVDFLHSQHETRTCVECHTTQVTMAPSPATAQCKECHSEHHSVGPTCSTCHQIAEPKLEHKSPEVAHVRCDACHKAQTVERLTPNRAFCGTCHEAKSKEHHDLRECTVCHFLSEPSAHKQRLLTPSAR